MYEVRGLVRLYYSSAYVAAEHEFDTTRKASWIAGSLVDRPIPGVEIVAPTPVTATDLGRIHDPRYVEAVRTGRPLALACSQGFEWDAALWTAVTASTGGAVAAARHALATRVNAGSLSSGLHHARRGQGAGFCTFNGLALAVRAAIDAGAGRVLIVDLDAHCGGGTYEILCAEKHVACVDIAVDSFDRYVPTSADWTLDVVGRAEAYLPTISARLIVAMSRRPSLVIYNAGMDPYEGSACGALDGVTAGMITARERLVFRIARDVDVPVAFVLAGGYCGSRLDVPGLVDLHRLTILAAAQRTVAP